MIQRSIEPNQLTFKSLLKDVADGGQWQQALHYYDVMQNRDITPDIVSVCSLLNAFELNDQHNTADAFYNSCTLDGSNIKAIIELDQRTSFGINANLNFTRHQDCEYTIDLHGLSVPQSRVVIRCALRELYRKVGEEICESGEPAMLIVGRGARSGEGGPMLSPAVLEYLEVALGIECRLDPNNEGRVLFTL